MVVCDGVAVAVRAHGMCAVSMGRNVVPNSGLHPQSWLVKIGGFVSIMETRCAHLEILQERVS